MLKKPNIYSRFALALVLLLSPILSLLTSSVTHASSAYDTTIDKVSNIELHNSACTTDTIDYTSNWASEFISSSSTLNYGGSAMTKTQAVNLFNNRTYWGVSQQDTGGNKSLLIWWTDSLTAPINFVMDGPFPSAAVQKSGSGTFADIGVNLQGTGSACSPQIYGSNFTTGSAYFPVAYDPNDASSLGFTFKPWRQFAKVNEAAVTGYAGEHLNKEISGTVVCGWAGGSDITNVYLETSSGQDGNAILSYNSTVDGQYYDFFMTNPSDSYSMSMICDGKLGTGLTSIDYSSDWICAYDETAHTYGCGSS
jgi:hypothetical protein